MNHLILVCKKCECEFESGKLSDDMRGRMTRKYCSDCRKSIHRKESREYQSERRKDYRYILKQRMYHYEYYRRNMK